MHHQPIRALAGPGPDVPSIITSILLSLNPTTTTAETLTLTLTPHLPHLTPNAINRTLKLLWNDAPRALLFFRSLPFPPPTSSSAHAADIAARHRLPLLPNHPFTPLTFSILAERLISHGKPDRAVRLFLNLHLHGLPQSLQTLNILLDSLSKSRRVEKAAILLRSLKGRFGADVVSYNVIADGWCRVKKTGKAMVVMKEMVERGIEPSLRSYNILLKGFFRAGQVGEGWRFFKEMKRRGMKPDVVTYTTVVHGLGVDGQVERARKVFGEMIGEGVLPSVATYNALIQV